MIKTITCDFILIFIVIAAKGQVPDNRWQLGKDNSITWNIKKDVPHNDHIEMSGKYISVVLRYSVNADSSFTATRSLVWPMLRTIPNNTHASLTRRFGVDGFDLITVNSKTVAKEKVNKIMLNGLVTINSSTTDNLELTRECFPSATQPAYLEIYSIKNRANEPCVIEIPQMQNVYKTDPARGTEGTYLLQMDVTNAGSFTLKKDESIRFSIQYTGRKTKDELIHMDADTEKLSRLAFVKTVSEQLVLETPDAILNQEFSFAKIRTSESIYETKGGPMHGPGGEAYYAAIWANDQAEYAGPFFPYLGYDYANSASLNAYMHFARFMNNEYKPIPSSIIAEGTDIWDGAGDRGDAAMIAYGAARFALTGGDPKQAQQLWPLIEWCLEYCKRKLNEEGVVTSDHDELEGRLPAGKANLNTSSLYFDALNSAVYLGRALGKNKSQLQQYKKEAAKLKLNIEKYFGATVEGFKTYKYYKENDVLRSWICVPLAMGIFDRKSGTVDALFSSRLWTTDGLLSVSTDKTFWDRSTLYALRGVLAAGESEKAIKYLHDYSRHRLLGNHVPYPVEAYPEGNQRHLSGESALYCRIFTEGLFGIRPTGFKNFQCTPRLPKEWPQMQLNHIHAFQNDFDLKVERIGQKLKVTVTGNGIAKIEKTIDDGETIAIALK